MAQRLRLNYKKFSLLLLFLLVLYNEWFCYFIKCYLFWPSIGAAGGQWKVRMLLVADPQIQGYLDEPSWPLGAITRWDSDRYLQKCFGYALGAYQPEVIIFMGDLIDEGSITDNETYGLYQKRFKNLFPHEGVKNVIYLPGDNDIGGEGKDQVTPIKMGRFQSSFENKELYKIRDHLEVVAVNRLADNLTIFENIPAAKSEKDIRLAVSHMPIIPMSGQFTADTLTKLKPSIILSAHFHSGMILKGDRRTGRAPGGYVKFFKESKGPKNFVVDNLYNKTTDIVEIIVPTCSYRMGVKEMAYGLAVIDLETGRFEYHNLWLPSRFKGLCIYLAGVITACVICVLGKCILPRR